MSDDFLKYAEWTIAGIVIPHYILVERYHEPYAGPREVIGPFLIAIRVTREQSNTDRYRLKGEQS